MLTKFALFVLAWALLDALASFHSNLALWAAVALGYVCYRSER